MRERNGSLTIIGTDHAKQYAPGQLTELNYYRNADDSHAYSCISHSLSTPLRFIWFPEITGCHIIIGIDKQTKKRWVSHVSVAQRDQEDVPDGCARPPPPYSQLLSENYPSSSMDTVGIEKKHQIDFLVIDKFGSFNESLFRDAIRDRAGKITVIQSDDRLKYQVVQIFYDLIDEKVYFLPDNRYRAETQQVHFKPILMKELFLVLPRLRSHPKILNRISEYIEDSIPVKEGAVEEYLYEVMDGISRPNIAEIQPILEEIKSRFEFPEAVFNQIKIVYTDKWIQSSNQALTFLQTGLQLLGTDEEEVKIAAIALITYAARELNGKQAAFFLAQLYANRRDENFKIPGDTIKALEFLHLAKENGSSTATIAIQNDEDGTEKWFIPPDIKEDKLPSSSRRPGSDLWAQPAAGDDHADKNIPTNEYTSNNNR